VDETLKLHSNGAIGKEDFQGNPEEILANGTVANRAILIIKDFTIANATIHNVELMVNSNLGYPLVIGNSVMDKFGSYSIDTQQQQIIIRKK
jgi:hypothetical protein